MLQEKREHPKVKDKLHPRNKHRERYDFKKLIAGCPELAPFVIVNAYKDESIDFFNPIAVKMLNKALLKSYYDIDYWDIPKNYLCPPIPGRADYIHHIADLLGVTNNGKIPTGNKIKCLDIGVGANCVYPIIANKEYGWSFICSDIDSIALESANKIIDMNSFLKKNVACRLQTNAKEFFKRIILKDELYDLSICNPPFHASLAESQASSQRKLNNLHGARITNPILNFGGQNTELWCEGGEERFVRDMIFKSEHFATSCFWFSSVVSKQAHLKNVYEALKHVEVVDVKTIQMGQGNKTSRIVAWTFLTPEQQAKWMNTRWS